MIRLEHPDLDPLVIDDYENGWTVQELNLGFPTVREVANDRPRANGSDDRTVHFGARVVSVTGTMVPNGGSDLRMMRDQLAMYLRPGLRPTMRFNQTSDGDLRRVDLRVDQFASVLDRPQLGEYQAQWVAPKGVIEADANGGLFIWPSSGAVGRTYDLTFNRDYPDHVGGPGLAVNSGTAPADWAAAIFGPCTSPQIINRTTGQTLSFPGLTIPGSTFLWLDSEARTATLNADPEASRYSWLDFAASTWWQMPPGESIIDFVPDSFGTDVSSAVVAFRWHDAYLI